MISRCSDRFFSLSSHIKSVETKGCETFRTLTKVGTQIGNLDERVEQLTEKLDVLTKRFNSHALANQQDLTHINTILKDRTCEEDCYNCGPEQEEKCFTASDIQFIRDYNELTTSAFCDKYGVAIECNHGMLWSKQDESTLRRHWNAYLFRAARVLGRTKGAIECKTASMKHDHKL